MKKALTLEERKARGAIFFDEGLTEQSHKDSCDINKIMSSYMKTGLVPVDSSRVPTVGDFSNVVDYHSAMNVVCAAQESFDSLPADIRKQFNYDPAEFLQAVEDPEQREKLIKLGVYADSSAALEANASSSIPESGVEVSASSEAGKA